VSFPIAISSTSGSGDAVRTTCPYCGVGCGVRARARPDGGHDIAGDEQHPANFGRLCVKGSALGETIGLDGRLLHPKMRERASGALRDVSWDEAIDAVADGFRRIVDEHGPDAVALYVSGQLLTEDYYVANKLMKGYVGSANIDTNSRLCMSSSVAGHKRAFGEDLVPVCYEDLELADLVVLVGSNTAWCHPILFQRILKMKEARPELKVVVIDPRYTATCEMADLHLPLSAGSDVRLFNGLLSFLAEHGATDAQFVDAHTSGFAQALAAASADAPGGFDLAQCAKACKVDPHDLLEFYRLFARTERVITVYSQGVNQSSSGSDKVNSIINCHLLTGRIGKPGMGPFSFTGQPNAMGGREVGGLANTLAAHLELDDAKHRELVQQFWGAPVIASRAGLKAVELFEAIEEGRVKAVWIMGTNPVVSLPDGDQAKRALARCELVVSSDIVERTDTNVFAHVLLPALGWGEKDGTVTNSERRISRQRAFLPAPGEARADWQIICDVAKRMGYAGFEFASQQEIFDEHARLSAWRNGESESESQSHSQHGDSVRRAFNLAGLVGLGSDGYSSLQPVQWPVRANNNTASDTAVQWPVRAGGDATARLFDNGRFSHADGRARFIPTPPRAPAHAPDDDHPLTLNTGRVRDQWHTMTRTGKSERLAGHVTEAFVDMHPQDGLLCGVREGDLARVSSRWGAMVARVQYGGGMPRGSVFVPIHWNDQVASDARVGAVVNPSVDPVSGEPEFKHTPVRVDKFHVAWHGFSLSRRAPVLDGVTYWTRVQGTQFVRYELAGRNPPGEEGDRGAWARALFCVDDAHADWLEYEDRAAGVYRAVHLVDDRIENCVFLSARPELPAREWLASLFAKERLDDAERIGVLSGQSLGKGADTGPTVCSCFGVGRNTICTAIREQGLKSAAEITACLKAGGNCGSCVPELKKLLVDTELARLNAA